MYRIVNIVMLMQFNRSFNKNELSQFKIKYLKCFNSGVINYEHSIVNLFFKGKAIISGIKDIKTGIMITQKFLKDLEKPAHIIEWRVVNITASGKLNSPPPFHKFISHPKVIYEPELFNAAYFQDKKFKNSKILFFHTGKFVITGIKSIKKLQQLYRCFRQDVEHIKSGKTI